jgi:hypothetical protein
MPEGGRVIETRDGTEFLGVATRGNERLTGLYVDKEGRRTIDEKVIETPRGTIRMSGITEGPDDSVGNIHTMSIGGAAHEGDHVVGMTVTNDGNGNVSIVGGNTYGISGGSVDGDVTFTSGPLPPGFHEQMEGIAEQGRELGEWGRQMGEWGRQMGEAGRRAGEEAREAGRLAREQGRAAREAGRLAREQGRAGRTRRVTGGPTADDPGRAEWNVTGGSRPADPPLADGDTVNIEPGGSYNGVRFPEGGSVTRAGGTTHIEGPVDMGGQVFGFDNGRPSPGIRFNEGVTFEGGMTTGDAMGITGGVFHGEVHIGRREGASRPKDQPDDRSVGDTPTTDAKKPDATKKTTKRPKPPGLGF